MIKNWQQMVSGDLQSIHAPVFAQGVDKPKRWALIGAKGKIEKGKAKIPISCYSVSFGKRIQDTEAICQMKQIIRRQENIKMMIS